MIESTNKHPVGHPSMPNHKDLWPRRNVWFAAALIFTFIGSLTLWASVRSGESAHYPSNSSPVLKLADRRSHVEKQIEQMSNGSHLLAISGLACLSVFPLNGLIALAWVTRRRWPLRMMAAGSIAIAALGVHSLAERIQTQRRELAEVITSQDEIRINGPKAKEIVARFGQHQLDANKALAEAERRLNETDVIDQLSLTTLAELEDRRQRLRDTLLALRRVLDTAKNHNTWQLAEFRKAGINPELSGNQAVYEDTTDRLQNINWEPSTPFPVRQAIYEIKLRMLDLTEQSWAYRKIDRRTSTIRIDGKPMMVRQYKALLKQLEDLENEDSPPDEKSESSDRSQAQTKAGH